MKITLFPPLSINEIGQRDNQEDAIIQWDDRLFVLCDGMGGHEKGEVASQTVCQSLAAWFQKNVNPDEPFTDDQLREAIEFAYTELDIFADGSPKQMGTTLTLLYIHRQGVTASHMGDSRIYHIRPGVGILYQSRDHSLVFDLFQAGEITYEEMATYPQKNMVTRAMTPGEDNRMRPDIIHITDVQPNDYFYMCSDGMMEKMTNNELLALFSADMDDKMKIGQLKMATNQNVDNHTAWIIHIMDVFKVENDDQYENEEESSRFNAINILPHPVYDAEDDDVVVVGGKKKSLFQKIIGIFK
jgi:protein phosphatase